jgi:hypothetical protein
MCANAPVQWRSSVSATRHHHSTESETHASAEAAKAAQQLIYFLENWGSEQRPMRLYTDNAAARKACLHKHGLTKKTAHIPKKAWTARDLAREGTTSIEKVYTHWNPSDMGTKALCRELYHQHMNMWMEKHTPVIKPKKAGAILMRKAEYLQRMGGGTPPTKEGDEEHGHAQAGKDPRRGPVISMSMAGSGAETSARLSRPVKRNGGSHHPENGAHEATRRVKPRELLKTLLTGIRGVKVNPSGETVRATGPTGDPGPDRPHGRRDDHEEGDSAHADSNARPSSRATITWGNPKAGTGQAATQHRRQKGSGKQCKRLAFTF